MMQSEIDKSKLYYLRRPKDRNFNPEDFLVPYIEKDQYGVYEKWHLPYEVRLAWFWDAYPDGQICFEGDPVIIKEGVYSSTVHLFSDQESKKRGNSLSSAKACKTVPGEDVDGSIAMAIQSQAIANALKRAGFVILFPAKRLQGDEIRAEIEGDSTIYIESKEADAMGDKAQNMSVPKIESQEEISEIDKLNAAMNMVCPIGTKKGKTLREIMMDDPSFITWIINKADHQPDLQNAAKLLLEHAVKMNQ